MKRQKKIENSLEKLFSHPTMEISHENSAKSVLETEIANPPGQNNLQEEPIAVPKDETHNPTSTQPVSAKVEDHQEKITREAVEEASTPETLAKITGQIQNKLSAGSTDSDAAVLTKIAETKEYNQSEHVVLVTLANQVYGIPISAVESIITMQAMTIVPKAPKFIDGVTNLRGKVLPVVNLHQRLGLKAREIQKDSRIVVVNLVNDISAGIIVDSVNAVLMIDVSLIEPPSPVVTTIDTTMVRGIAKIDHQLVILLDLERVLKVD